MYLFTTMRIKKHKVIVIINNTNNYQLQKNIVGQVKHLFLMEIYLKKRILETTHKE